MRIFYGILGLATVYLNFKILDEIQQVRSLLEFIDKFEEDSEYPGYF